MIPLRLEVLVTNEDLPQFNRPLSGQGLDQLALTIARHPGDANDFACGDLEVEPADRVAPLVVLSEKTGNLERRSVLRRDRARRGGAHDRIADHHRGHLAGRNGADLSAADPRAAPQHGEVVAERLDLAELVADHRDRDFAAVGHIAKKPKDFVRLPRRQDRRRLIEDEKALVEIEQLEDLELLLFARRHARDGLAERDPERHAVKKIFEALSFLAPVDERRRVGAADDEILSCGQRRHEGEMLIDHADAERLRVLGIAHGGLVPVKQKLALVRRVEAHDAFDERRFAGAVFAEKGVKRACRNVNRHVLKRAQRAEGLAHADRFERRRARRGCGRAYGHGIASMKAVERPTAPNTPPCILTILSAAR